MSVCLDNTPFQPSVNITRKVINGTIYWYLDGTEAAYEEIDPLLDAASFAYLVSQSELDGSAHIIRPATQ